MRDVEAKKLTDVLVSASASVAAVTNALGTRLSEAAIRELQNQANLLYDCNSLSTLGVPSNVRQAAVALTRDLQAANKALKAQLLAEQRPARHEASLLLVARALQGFFMGLVTMLGEPTLSGTVQERAASDPSSFIRTLSACFDLILERPPPEMDEEEAGMQRAALSFWGKAAMFAFIACGTDCSVRTPLVTDTLGCVQRAAAATAFVLQPHGVGDGLWNAALHGMLGLTVMAPVLHLGPGVDTAAVVVNSGSKTAAIQALFLSAMSAVEGIARVAALLPDSGQQLDHETTHHLLAGYQNCTALATECLSHSWSMVLQQPGVVLSQATAAAAASVVESVAKLALVTASGAAGPRQSAARGPPNLQRKLLDRLAEACMTVIQLVAPLVKTGELAMDDATIKRWQAVSLAACSTVVALAGSESQALPSDYFLPLSFKLLPLSLLPWPGIRDLLPSVPVGRPAVRQALVDLSERDLDEDEQRITSATLYHLATLMQPIHPGHRETALVLAQLGTLSQLASWGEQQCGKSPSDESLEGLGQVQQLVKWAVQSCGVAEVQAAYELLHEGQVSKPEGQVSKPEYWRRLREEVTEPLAAALEAKAAAETDPAQVAVDVAEALATRTCAYVGCTTVVGASEAAAPRGKRCSACRLVRYCAAACQKADWPAHKAACRELRRRSAGGS